MRRSFFQSFFDDIRSWFPVSLCSPRRSLALRGRGQFAAKIFLPFGEQLNATSAGREFCPYVFLCSDAWGGRSSRQTRFHLPSAHSPSFRPGAISSACAWYLCLYYLNGIFPHGGFFSMRRHRASSQFFLWWERFWSLYTQREKLPAPIKAVLSRGAPALAAPHHTKISPASSGRTIPEIRDSLTRSLGSRRSPLYPIVPKVDRGISRQADPVLSVCEDRLGRTARYRIFLPPWRARVTGAHESPRITGQRRARRSRDICQSVARPFFRRSESKAGRDGPAF